MGFWRGVRGVVLIIIYLLDRETNHLRCSAERHTFHIRLSQNLVS